MVGGEVVLCGQYLVTYNSSAVGIMEGDAGIPTIEPATKGRPINNTDAYGDTTIDAIYRGSDFFAAFTCLEYKAASKAVLWPFSPTQARMGVIGRLYFDMAAALVFTAVTGTPAATAADPATLTASKAILAPGFSSRLLFGPVVRTIPLRLQLFPYTSGANVNWYVLT